MDKTNGTLQLCAVDSSGTNGILIPFGETCFNRFCSWTDGTQNPSQGTAYCTLNGCPAGYSWANYNNSQDIITTSNVGSTYYHVESVVCCSANGVIKPT